MNKHRGSAFESLFEDTGELESVIARALKKGFSETVRTRMVEASVSKKELADALGTSRSQLDRSLDPDDVSITLMTMVRISRVLGLDARFDFARSKVPKPKRRPRTAAPQHRARQTG